jgi:type I restriction enzyme, S subunit
MSEKVHNSWKIKSLGDFLSLLPKSKLPSGLSDKTGYYNFYVCSQNILRSFYNEMSSPAVLLSTGGEAAVHYAIGEYSYSTDVWATNFTGEIYDEYAFRVLEKDLEKINYSGFQGSGIKHLDKKFIKKLTYAIPPLSEQKKIVSILRSVDKVIETTQKKIYKLQDLKKATMNELLTKGIGHIEFKDSKLGRIPKSWEVRKVGEFAEVTKLAGFEYTDHFDYSVGGEIIAIRALNLTNGKLDLRNVQTIPREVSDKLPRSKLYSGDILITYVGVNIGELGFIDQDNKYHLAPNVGKISFNKEEIDSNFMFQQMIYERTQRNIKKLTGVTSQPSLNMSNIREILVSVPEIHEQKRIGKIFKNFDEQIYGIKGKIFSLTCLKKSLMQDLLTGKVRVQVN